jgi:hypothetical protein
LFIEPVFEYCPFVVLPTDILATIKGVETRLADFDENNVAIPSFDAASDEKLGSICDWALFGRMRRDASVEVSCAMLQSTLVLLMVLLNSMRYVLLNDPGNSVLYCIPR